MCTWIGWICCARVNENDDIEVKTEMEIKNGRTEKKEAYDKNETLKGRSSGKQRTEKSRNSTEGTSRVSRE